MQLYSSLSLRKSIHGEFKPRTDEARFRSRARDRCVELNLYPAQARRWPTASRRSTCVYHPDGAHSIACGLDADLDVQIHGHVGYYVAGMNQLAAVTVHGNAGPGRRLKT